MNIFYLSNSPRECARYHCDKHVVKMCLETAQLLSTAHHVKGDGATYKLTHENHPCAVWVRSSSAAYFWTFKLFEALLSEYQYRYGREHACTRLVDELRVLPERILHRTYCKSPPQCMPEHRKRQNDPIGAYRHYYFTEKRHLCAWAHSPKPYWFEAKEFFEQLDSQAECHD